MTEDQDKTTLVIVGGGTAGWMSAAILAQFSENGYRIILIESDEISTVGVGEATIPQITIYNQALGLDEDAFLRATQGTYKLGIEFVDWDQFGSRYMHAFGGIGRDIGIVPFQHYWHRARALGKAKTLDAYSLNEVAARALKMQRGALKTSDKLHDMPYAFHFDAGLYAAYLRRFAEARGVERIEGMIGDATLSGESGDVASVTLKDGRVIEGDFFLDCSGFRGLLQDPLYEGGADAARIQPAFVSNHDNGRFAYFVRTAFPNAADAEVLARVRLAHAMLFTLRGVPTIYAGDEQGFTGDGWDQDAREDMFPSKVAVYNDNKLLGTSATTAQSNFDEGHPLYKLIAELAGLRHSHPALRRGKQIVRAWRDTPGLFAVSRIDPATGQEIVIAFNTSSDPVSANVEIGSDVAALVSLHGQCPAVPRAPASVTLSLPPLDFILCAATPK